MLIAGPEATRWKDLVGLSFWVPAEEPPDIDGKALSERENEILETGELSKSGDGGLIGSSGCRDASWGVGGEEWFDFEDEPFERRTKLPSGSIM